MLSLGTWAPTVIPKVGADASNSSRDTRPTPTDPKKLSVPYVAAAPMLVALLEKARAAPT